MMIRNIVLFTTLSMLAACGSPTPDSNIDSNLSILSGKVADGYLTGATVCLDKNYNKVCDPDEPQAVSGNDGSYSLHADAQDIKNHPIIVIVPTTAVDGDTGKNVTKPYVLSAPPGKGEFISPVTTLVQTDMERDPTRNIADVELSIAREFNLANGTTALYGDFVADHDINEDAKQLHNVSRVVAHAIGEMIDDIATVVASDDTITDEDGDALELGIIVDDVVRLNLNQVARAVQQDADGELTEQEIVDALKPIVYDSENVTASAANLTEKLVEVKKVTERILPRPAVLTLNIAGKDWDGYNGVINDYNPYGNNRYSALTPLLGNIYEGLTNVDHNGVITPGVAYDWASSSDGLTHTFYLRDDAFWSDGAPVIAADFVAASHMLADSWNPKYNIALEMLVLLSIENAEAVISDTLGADSLGFKAVSDKVLEIKTSKPNGYLPIALSEIIFMPVPSARISTPKWNQPEVAVSNGPYMLDPTWQSEVSAVKDAGGDPTKLLNLHQQVKLVKNPMYWNSKINIADEVVHYIHKTAEEIETLAVAGSIDVAIGYDLSATASNLISRPTGKACAYLYDFNMASTGPMGNLSVRKAVAKVLSSDRASMIAKLMPNGAYELITTIPNNQNGVVLNKPAYLDMGMAEARDLIEVLAFDAVDGQTGPFTDVNKLALSITFNGYWDGTYLLDGTTPKIDHTVHWDTAVAAKTLLEANLPVAVTLNELTWNDYLAERDYDIKRDGWCADYMDVMSYLDAPPFKYYSLLDTVNSRAFDDHITSANTESNYIARTKHFNEALSLFEEDVRAVPIYRYGTVFYTKPNVNLQMIPGRLMGLKQIQARYVKVNW